MEIRPNSISWTNATGLTWIQSGPQRGTVFSAQQRGAAEDLKGLTPEDYFNPTVQSSMENRNFTQL